MHPTSFHFGFVETILFKEWQISNWQGMLGSAIAITVLAALYESLKYYREYLHSRKRKYVESGRNTSALTNIFSSSHATQTILVAVQVFLSNILMLVFMTYNVYLCVAMVVGATLGYFLLFWRPHIKRVIIKIENENTETNTDPTEVSTSV